MQLTKYFADIIVKEYRDGFIRDIIGLCSNTHQSILVAVHTIKAVHPSASLRNLVKNIYKIGPWFKQSYTATPPTYNEFANTVKNI